MIDADKALDVRSRIMDAARALFVQKGFKGATVRDIANASDTNVAMVNYYFHSKNQLFQSIFEEAFFMLADKIFSAIDSELPFFDMIRKWMETYFETLREYPQLPIFVINELCKNPRIFDEKLQLKSPCQIYARLAILFNEEEKKGVIQKIPVSDFLLNLVSLSVFPFVAGPVATKYLNISETQYADMLQSHKKYVIDFIIHAIRKES